MNKHPPPMGGYQKMEVDIMNKKLLECYCNHKKGGLYRYITLEYNNINSQYTIYIYKYENCCILYIKDFYNIKQTLVHLKDILEYYKNMLDVENKKNNIVSIYR